MGSLLLAREASRAKSTFASQVGIGSPDRALQKTQPDHPQDSHARRRPVKKSSDATACTPNSSTHRGAQFHFSEQSCVSAGIHRPTDLQTPPHTPTKSGILWAMLTPPFGAFSETTSADHIPPHACPRRPVARPGGTTNSIVPGSQL